MCYSRQIKRHSNEAESTLSHRRGGGGEAGLGVFPISFAPFVFSRDRDGVIQAKKIGSQNHLQN